MDEFEKAIQEQQLERSKAIADSFRGLTEIVGGLIVIGITKGLFTAAEFDTARSQAVAYVDQQFADNENKARELWAGIPGGIELFDKVFGR